MTEQNLIDLGFQKEYEMNESPPFYYYVYEFSNFTMITNTNDEAEEDGWVVEFFECGDFKYNEAQDVENLINILKVGLK
jgi:hypothetical protein